MLIQVTNSLQSLAQNLSFIFLTTSNQNVRVDVFYQSYKAKSKIRLNRLGLIFLLLPVSAYTTWVSIGPMVNSWELLEASPTFGGLPGYFLLKTVQWLVFAGLTVVTIFLMLKPSIWADANKENEESDAP